MRTHLISKRPRAGTARLLTVLTLAAAVSATAAACSSSSSAPSASASSSTAAALGQQCTAVSDVLSDGPDPTADSVGYAQAQILPLRQLTLADSALQAAVTKLDAAFSAFAAATGSAQAQAAVKVTDAEDAVNAICPGASS